MAQPKIKPGDSFPNVKKSRVAEATGGEAATRTEFNSVYDGEVIARQGDGTYRVAISDPGMELTDVRLAFPVLGGLLGLNIRCNLPQNTKVKVAYGTPSYIFAVLPENNTDWLNARTRSLIFGPKMDDEQGVEENKFSTHAEDLLEGEVEFTNLYGVAMDFLTNILRLRAGDRAAVECHLINDMVRIISAQYRHISGLGEDLIFDHGRPTLERGWSSYRHEVLGALKEKEDYAKLNGDEVDRDELEARRVTGLGRHRFREFIGFAGDFIHSFISDPPEAMASLAKGSADAGAGKSWLHRNSDGSVIINSVADIRIERTCRVPVAVRQEHHENPGITKERAYDQLNKDYLKLPDMVAPVDPKDAFRMAYHIRSYARWLGRYHSFARMLQMEEQTGEYKVPSESESPEPDWNNQEEDRKDQNPRVSYYDAYACISIMRDGSIVNHDGYGSSIVMSNGNVQVSAARHLDLEAAGDIRLVAGGSILAKARRNIEFSAALGGIVIHGYAWLKMLCERGTAWVRSNAKTGKDEDPPEPKEDGAPTPEIAGYESGEKDGFAVLIEATEGSAAYRSQKGAVLAVDGSPSDDDDQSCDLIISTKGDLDLFGSRLADLHSREAVRISSGSDIAIATNVFMTNAAEFLMGPNMDSPFLVMRYGKLYCREIEGQVIRSNTFLGPERKGSVPIPDQAPTVQLKPHLNHIDTLQEEVEAPEGADEDEKTLMDEAIQLAASSPELPWLSQSDGPKWSFPPSSEYLWDDREAVPGAVPETITQQYLRLDAETGDPDRWEGLGYADWDLRSPITGQRTESNAGFGTYEQHFKADDSGENLHEPSGTAPKDMDLPVASWRPKGSFSIKALKREGES